MSMKKNEAKETEKATVLTFKKEKIVASKKYAPFADFLNGNLKDNQEYSLAEVDDLLIANKFLKGKGE